MTSGAAKGSIDLGLNEWVVLALLAEAPAHGFALAKELQAESDLGRILTVHRPLVYRALDRLFAAGLIEAYATEPGTAGPNRTVHRPTRKGRSAVDRWLTRPVEHVRDLRMEFLVKLRLTERAGRDRRPLVRLQRATLESAFERLGRVTADDDVVDLWRRHNARAAHAFLEQLG